MKPISIRFKCFGPYTDEQFIDFEELSSKGIFLISGETGSGKTTILDAMCYALFGKSSGGLRGEIEVMRCKSASPDDETLVEYIFESNGKTYKFHRELRFGRKNMNEYDGCEILRDGIFVPIFENPKKTAVNKKAEEILGLTYDQFCQVVILPQGKFEKLLVSDSEDKEEILTGLFHADRWNLLVKKLKEQVDNEKKRLDDEYKDIHGKLSVFECETLDELIAETEKLKEEVKQKNNLLEQLKKEKETKSKTFEAALTYDELFKTLDDYKKKSETLLNKKEDYEEKRRNLKSSENADFIREIYTAYKAAEKADENAEKDFNQANEAVKKFKEENEKLIKRKQIHEEGKEKYENDNINLIKFKGAKQLYSDIVIKKELCDKLKKELELKEREKSDLEKELENKNKKWDAAKAENDKAIAFYTRINTLYLANISGILAEDLQEGVPCPVCGSKEHPAPAKITCDEKISKEDVDNANKKIKAASDALDKCSEEREDKEKELRNLKAVYDKVKENYTAAKADYESADKNKFDDIDDSKQLEKIIEKTEKEISEYEKVEKDMIAELKTAGEKIAAAEQSLKDKTSAKDNAEKLLEEESEKWKKALFEKGFKEESEFTAALIDKEKIKEFSEEITQYDADVKSAQENLTVQENKVKGLIRPDIKEAERIKKEAEEKYTAENSELSTLKNTLEQEDKQCRLLSERLEKYNADRVVSDSNIDFARKLNPSSGMSLQRYVLGIMLSSIITAANHLLKEVHGGKYRLLRSYESAGSARKAGLELDVADTGTGEKRSVTTLSGGEKFLAALCLAIGLSTVVQAQSGGTKLEAMFIDEGFGSLDNNSINDALDVLQGIRESHGLVGIISHVDKLTETIPTRLDVVKGANGNRIRMIL